MNIVLVDDHALVRTGIRYMIDDIEGLTVVGEANGNVRAMELVGALRPDMVVTDISMGDDSGLDLLAQIKRAAPQTRVVLLTMHASEEMVSEALRLGADGYLLKDATAGELEVALRAVARGESYLSPSVSKAMIDRFVRPPAATDPALDLLTARQQQILTMIASRKSTKEIAYELDLSEKTIAAHRAQIMERTGVRDVVGLVLFAVKHGLVKKP
jgi:DNA-binding NarL/FixJ family response regulator